MLGDNEPIQGIDLGDVLALMVGELPWPTMQACVQANAQLVKLCTLGGHRLGAKQRKRVEKILRKEAEKAEYSQAFCSGLFAGWYPVHKTLHKALEDHFHSEEYKKYREEHELEDDAYVLTDEKFEEFFELDKLEQWQILLCFSPLKFSTSQAGKVLGDSEGAADLLRRLRETEERLAGVENDRTRLRGEHDNLRTQHEQASLEAQTQRRAQRDLKVVCEGLEKKLEQAQNENRKLRAELAAAERSRAALEKRIAAETEKATVRIAGDLKRLQEQLAEWQDKYEQQRVNNRQLESDIAAARAATAAAEESLEQNRQEMAVMCSFADLLIGRFDWPKIGAQMKMTPVLKRQFNSVIRKLTYEEDRSLSLDGTLATFWDQLMSKEKTLIDCIAESNTREVMAGDVEAYWLELTDAFEDVRIGLEARCVLLKTLHEIFYQILEMDDLEVPKLPKATTK